MSATDTRARYLATVPVSARGIVARAYDGGSRANAIKAMCLACCHFDRGEVANCTVVLCPLHEFRPFAAQQPRKIASVANEVADGVVSPDEQGEPA